MLFKSTHWRAALLALALLFLLLPTAGYGQSNPTTLDFEDFSGTLTTSPQLDEFGISFGTPSVELTGLPDLQNQPLGPVTIFQRDNAPSGKNVAGNCSGGIGCEFPSGAVLMEFVQPTRSISFRVRGFDDGSALLIYGYDTDGRVEPLQRTPITTEWQTIRVSGAKGYVLDLDKATGSESFFLDDIVYSFGDDPEPERDCGTGENLLNLLDNDPIFRQEYDRILRLTENYLEGLRTEGNELAFGGEVITIPVVVHVVYGTDTENISDAQIQSQIDAMNEAFRAANADVSTVPAAFASQVGDLRIQFALAQRDPDCEATTGITRTNTTVSSFNFSSTAATATARNPVKFTSSGGRDGWPSDEYLNMWVCDLAGTLLGYGSWPAFLASRPAEDGVVMNYRHFGTTGTIADRFDRGRTTVHEVGHWLNLRHIWGDDNDEADECSFSDGVDDTPNQGLQNLRCPAFPSESCENGPNGDMFMNYMDYVDDDCMTMFTLGQHVRAAAALFTVRTDILGSEGNLPPPEMPTASDLWSADTYDDIGSEPNATTESVYHSADIWVRPTNDGITNQEHTDPVYRADGSPNYVYVRVRNRGCGGTESGTVRLTWAKASSGLGWPQPWDGSITTPALMGSAIGSSAVSVDGGEYTVLEFPWVVPNPADYASFGADRAHFCLLSRIEDADGMTFPETGSLWNNVKNNNNIVWKNISIGTDDGDGSGRFLNQIIVANYEGEGRLMDLRFDLPEDNVRSLLDYGRVFLRSEKLFALWRENGAQSKGIEPLDDGTLELLDPEAALFEIPLAAGALLPLDVLFAPDPSRTINTVHRLNMTQWDTKSDAPIGGNQFRFRTFAKGVIFPDNGGGNGELMPPVFVDCPGEVPSGCTFPVTVRIDMSNVPQPDNFLGNFTGVFTYNPNLMEYVEGAEVLSGYTGFVNPSPGLILFNGADAKGVDGDIPVFRAIFRALAPSGSSLNTSLEMTSLAAATTFKDLSKTATVFDCELKVGNDRLLGDVDGDGRITSTDAAMILAFSVGNPIPAAAKDRIEAGLGDVDGTGVTNPRDALIILSFEVGLSVDFPVGTSACPDTKFEEKRGRSSLSAPVEIGWELDNGDLLIPVTVDLSNTGERLGSYQLNLDWDPTRYQFVALEPSATQGFERPAVNLTEAGNGRVRLAHANAKGAGNQVVLTTLRLAPVTSTDVSPKLSVRISDLTAAGNFQPIEPVVTYAQTTPVTELNKADFTLTVSPNPTRGRATFRVNLPATDDLEVTLFDGHGRKITTLAQGVYGTGTHLITWTAPAQLAPGVYLVRVRAGTQVRSQRLVLLR